MTLVLGLLLVAGCGASNGGPTTEATPSEPPEPSLVPVATPAPTQVVTLAPGASPSFDIGTLLNAQITVYNLSDADLTVDAVIHDPTTPGNDVPISNFTLGPNQVASRDVLGGNTDTGPVPYRVTFSYASGVTAAGGECTVSVLKSDAFSFVAANEGVTVSRDGQTPASRAEMLIATSSLCVPPPAPTATP